MSCGLEGREEREGRVGAGLGDGTEAVGPLKVRIREAREREAFRF